MRHWVVGALGGLLALLPQQAQPIRCSVTVCSDDGRPLQEDRCPFPGLDRTEERDCDAFGSGYDRCQRIHVRDPRGEALSGIPAAGAYFYRCAKSTQPATYHCGACDSRGACADDYSSDGYRPDLYQRFWCCDSAVCNNPAADSGLQTEQFQVGWTYQQSVASGVWDGPEQCGEEVTTAAEILLFELSPQQMGACTTTPQLGDVQAWAGAQAQTGQYMEWQSMCVACDVGRGRLGESVATHYFYRDSSCSAFSVSKISHYRNPEQCDWDPDRQRGFVSSCDTASTCSSPALDGLIIYSHADASCGLAGRTYLVALPAEEVVASTDAGLCLSRDSATQLHQQVLFEKLPAGVMGVRACCQQDAAFLYFFADHSCRNYGLQPETGETDLRRGLRFSLLDNADCEAKRISADFSELWVSAECTSSFGAYCPPLEDRSPPTIACPDLSDLDISVDFVARLRRDNLVDAFLEGSRLPDASEQHEITTGTVAGGGVPLMAASAVDRQDFIFQTFGGNAIRTPIRTFARLGEQDSNVSWTDSTRFPVGTSHMFFEAEDMSGHVAGAQLAGDVATCAVVVALLDICAELGNYCGEHGNCQPGTGNCTCKVDREVEQVVCGGGTACDGAGDGPCHCDPCEGCSDGSTRWTGERCEVFPVGNVKGVEKKSWLWLFLLMLAILFSVAAGCVCWRKKNSEKEKASQVSGVVSFKKKRQVYGDIPSFKVTGAYGQRPESFLSTAMKAEEEKRALAEETKRKEQLSRKGEVVIRQESMDPAAHKKKKKKKKKASSKVAPT